jgi:hypothetical protein|tara:strand:+ start:2706 stop:3035 length:330 start_codon:yes stop_codon:yes gene_type:complete
MDDLEICVDQNVPYKGQIRRIDESLVYVSLFLPGEKELFGEFSRDDFPKKGVRTGRIFEYSYREDSEQESGYKVSIKMVELKPISAEALAKLRAEVEQDLEDIPDEFFQ